MLLGTGDPYTFDATGLRLIEAPALAFLSSNPPYVIGMKGRLHAFLIAVISTVLFASCTMSAWRMTYLKKTHYQPESGKYISLKSHIFSPKSMMTGITRPEKFASVYGVSIFLTEPHVKGRLPIVLVHGHMTGPRPFGKLIASLDKKRFEPWIVLYPSGQLLKWTVAMLRESISRQAAAQGVDSVVVLGLSQGGIVTRKALGVQLDGVQMPQVPLYVGVAPAYGGLRTNLGLGKPAFAPPSWDDILADSPFIEQLFDDPLPEETSLHIVYGLLEDDSDVIPGPDDGALSEQSLARPEAVAEARSVTVIPGVGHGKIIEDARTIAIVDKLLDEVWNASLVPPPQ
jgi:hypothetical protein